MNVLSIRQRVMSVKCFEVQQQNECLNVSSHTAGEGGGEWR
jgi:hypothetical protein